MGLVERNKEIEYSFLILNGCVLRTKVKDLINTSSTTTNKIGTDSDSVNDKVLSPMLSSILYSTLLLSQKVKI